MFKITSHFAHANKFFMQTNLTPKTEDLIYARTSNRGNVHRTYYRPYA
jgi:hypothetical protein